MPARIPGKDVRRYGHFPQDAPQSKRCRPLACLESTATPYFSRFERPQASLKMRQIIRPAGRATEHGLGVRPSQSYSSPNCQLEELGACSYRLFLTASFPLSESHLAEPLNRSVYKPSAALGRRPSIARPSRCVYDYRPWSLRQKQVRIGTAKSTRNRLGYLNIHHRASTRASSSQTTSCLALVWS